MAETLNSAAALLMFRGRHRRGTKLVFAVGLLLSCLAAVAQVVTQTGQITGTVKDPAGAIVAGANVSLKDLQGRVKATAVSDGQGVYAFASVEPGIYIIEVDAKGFRHAASPNLEVAATQTVTFDCTLSIAEHSETVTVSANVENAYRVDTVSTGGPLGTAPILDLPYSVNVISRELIDDTQSRNFKEAAKYLPLVFFQEMQGPEVLRPETRGMQGSNMQNDRKDGMGFAVTTPSALEEYEQTRGRRRLGRPDVWSREPLRHVQLRHQEAHRTCPCAKLNWGTRATALAPFTSTWATASARGRSSATGPIWCWPMAPATSRKANSGAS